MTTQENHYFKEIEQHILRARGRGLMLGGADYAVMERWEKMGIPVDIVKRGIDISMDGIRFNGKGNVNGIVQLSSCSRKVLELWKGRKESFIGRNDIGRNDAGRNNNEVAEDQVYSEDKLSHEIRKMAEKLASGDLCLWLPSAINVVKDSEEQLDGIMEAVTEKRISHVQAAEMLEKIRDEFYWNIRIFLTREQESELLGKREKMLQNLRKNMSEQEYERTIEELLLVALAERTGI